MNLDEQLSALREAERRAETPARVETAVMAAFEGQRSTVRGQSQAKGPRPAKGLALGAMAAGIIVGVGSSAIYFNRAPQTPTLRAEPVSESVVLVVEPPGVQEHVRAVRIRVSRAALESLGIETVASQGSDTVEVDVLVGEDGVARGVRLAM